MADTDVKMQERGILIGATKEKNLVFADIAIRKNDWRVFEGEFDDYYSFTASFNEVRPFNTESFDVEGYWRDNIDSFDTETKLDMLEKYDCRCSELAEYIADDFGVDGTLDIYSDYDYVDVDGYEWALENVACGQHDTRDDMGIVMNESAYNDLLNLWDTYHLKYVDENTAKAIRGELDSILERLWEGMGEDTVEDWVCKFIQANENELDGGAY